MLLAPHQRECSVRYPDDTIVPTAMVHLTTSSTYTVDASTDFVTGLRWKVIPTLLDPEPGVDPTVSLPVYYPRPLTGTGPYSLAKKASYGGPQDAWMSVNSIDRTLALGIRLRLVGLPTSTFLPSGTLYFIQYQNRDVDQFVPSSEEYFMQAVTAGRGFSMTVAEMARTNGVNIPYLPQGPMSFVFSEAGNASAAQQGQTALPQFWSTVAANGGLLIAGFGCAAGQTFRFDYSHHIEYVPRPESAGLIATSVQPPSGGVRDALASTTQRVQSRLAGATSLEGIKPLVTGGTGNAVGTVLGQLAGSRFGEGGMAVGGAIGSIAGLLYDTAQESVSKSKQSTALVAAPRRRPMGSTRVMLLE